MKRRRTYILAGIALAGAVALITGLTALSHNLEVQRKERESHFVAIHFLAEEVSQEGNPEGPRDYRRLLEFWGGTAGSSLGDPFVDGLDYRPLGGGFILEEPRRRRVSLLRSDRLIATDRNWPRWESTGEYARKFPGQEVPPPGYK